MMREEFEKRVNFSVMPKEYEKIEKKYMDGFFGKDIDKDEFCKQWLNSGGIKEVLQARINGEVELPPIKRYKSDELFLLIVNRLKKSGEIKEAEKILDYYLPNEHEPNLSRDSVLLTNCEFNFNAIANFGGSEGIYLDCFFKGTFDDSGREYLDIGTFKTLNDDLKSMKTIAELGGILNYHLTKFINKNIECFVPDEVRISWVKQRAERDLKKLGKNLTFNENEENSDINNEEVYKKKTRLFVDMDGTLARFHDEVNYIERMYEEGFFLNLKPFEEAVQGIKDLIENHKDVEVFILSAEIEGEPPYCRIEKNAWIDKHLPEIDSEHRIFTVMGEQKANYIENGISKNDFLWDDYNVGLEQWEKDGGIGIKCKNNINHKGLVGKLWEGLLVENNNRYKTVLNNADVSGNLYSVIAGNKAERYKDITINGYDGYWTVIDKGMLDGSEYFLFQSDENDFNIVADKDLCIYENDIRSNSMDEYIDENIWAEYLNENTSYSLSFNAQEFIYKNNFKEGLKMVDNGKELDTDIVDLSFNIIPKAESLAEIYKKEGNIKNSEKIYTAVINLSKERGTQEDIKIIIEAAKEYEFLNSNLNEKENALSVNMKKLNEAKGKYGEKSYEYEYLKNELSLNIDEYANLINSINNEFNKHGFENSDIAVQDYLNEYIETVNIHPLPEDLNKIVSFIKQHMAAQKQEITKRELNDNKNQNNKEDLKMAENNNKLITVTTQTEFNTIPLDYKGQIIINGGTRDVGYGYDNSNPIVIKHNYKNAEIIATENSVIKVYNDVEITIRDNVYADLYNNVKAKAYDNSSVGVFDNFIIEAYGNSKIETHGNSKVKVFDFVSVKACDYSNIEAYGNSTVNAESYKNVIKIDGEYFDTSTDSFATILLFDNAKAEDWSIGEATILPGVKITVENVEKEKLINKLLEELKLGEPEDYGYDEGLKEIEKNLQSKSTEELRVEWENVLKQADKDAKMDIQARVTPIESEGKVKGLSTVIVNGVFAINSVKVIEGEKGLSVLMPSRKDKNGNFNDIAYPLTDIVRKQIHDAVIEAYQNPSNEKTNSQATDIKISVSLHENTFDNNIKAGGQITLNDSIVVKDVKVIEGKNGLFVQMPSYQDSDGGYQPIAHPITKGFLKK